MRLISFEHSELKIKYVKLKANELKNTNTYRNNLSNNTNWLMFGITKPFILYKHKKKQEKHRALKILMEARISLAK